MIYFFDIDYLAKGCWFVGQGVWWDSFSADYDFTDWLGLLDFISCKSDLWEAENSENSYYAINNHCGKQQVDVTTGSACVPLAYMKSPEKGRVRLLPNRITINTPDFKRFGRSLTLPKTHSMDFFNSFMLFCFGHKTKENADRDVRDPGENTLYKTKPPGWREADDVGSH